MVVEGQPRWYPSSIRDLSLRRTERSKISHSRLGSCQSWQAGMSIRVYLTNHETNTLNLQLLLPSPFATPEAQIHLLNLTKCSTFLHSASMGLLVDRVLGEKSHIRTLEIPELAEWLRNEEAHPFPYDKTWDEGKSDPWLIFHTSGTTGRMRCSSN